MSTYTVLQDIEAEDKLLGPLTLRQFIYAGIAVATGFIMFMIAKTSPFLAVPFLPILLVFGFLAAPFGKDQPTETWAVAKVRYWFKPRKRIWDQTGQKDLVEITVPKHEAVQYTDGLSQHEVRSRLQALASTIDSRGWVVKTAAYGQPAQLPVAFAPSNESDRLTGAATLPQAVSSYGNEPTYDVLEQSSQVSQQINQMITNSEQTHRQQIIDKLNSPNPLPALTINATQPTDQQWFAPPTSSVPAQVPSQDDAMLLANLQERAEVSQKYTTSHLKTIQPISPTSPTSSVLPVANAYQTSQASPPPAAQPAPIPAVTATPDPAILVLSRNDDLDVATIARQAKKQLPEEVVISLH